jgi:hypothetical protein
VSRYLRSALAAVGKEAKKTWYTEGGGGSGAAGGGGGGSCWNGRLRGRRPREVAEGGDRGWRPRVAADDDRGGGGLEEEKVVSSLGNRVSIEARGARARRIHKG